MRVALVYPDDGINALKPRYTSTRLNVTHPRDTDIVCFMEQWEKTILSATTSFRKTSFSKGAQICSTLPTQWTRSTHIGLWEFWWRIKLWGDELMCLIHRQVRINVSESWVCRQYVPPNGRYPRIRRQSVLTQSTTIHKFTQNNMMPMWTGIIEANLHFYFCIIKFIPIISKFSDHISQKTRKLSFNNATN
jgi:hypothetical protein